MNAYHSKKSGVHIQVPKMMVVDLMRLKYQPHLWLKEGNSLGLECLISSDMTSFSVANLDTIRTVFTVEYREEFDPPFLLDLYSHETGVGSEIVHREICFDINEILSCLGDDSKEPLYEVLTALFRAVNPTTFLS